MPHTLSNPYCTLDDLKTALRITDTNDDDRLSWAINAASRQIENFTKRKFWLESSATDRLFVPTTYTLCEVDDFQTLTGLVVKTDPAGDGSFPVTWDAADYQLEPVNAQYDGQPWTFTKIRAIRNKIFPAYGTSGYPVPNVQALVKVTAKWGWTTIPDDVAMACLFQSELLFKMVDVPLGGTPWEQTGQAVAGNPLHATAAAMLSDYDAVGVLVG